MRFRLITYNIHKGIGGADRRYRLQRIGDVLAHYKADVVLLQEVDRGVPRSRRDDQATLLADALGIPHVAYQRNVKLTIGGYGNAILSRFPLADTENIDLTIPLKKRRQSLATRCQFARGGHTGSLLLVNVHLGLSGIERQIQLRRLLNHQLLKGAPARTPILVGGDYNDVWGTLGKRIMGPHGYSEVSRALRTFPAVMPLRALDRVFFRGPIVLDHAFAGRTRLTRQASDHLPVIADFKLGVNSSR